MEGFNELLAQAKENYRNGEVCWARCSNEIADHFLGCVPPVYGNDGSGAFACGEPWLHNDAGESIHLCFRRCDWKENKAEARYLSLRELKAVEK